MKRSDVCTTTGYAAAHLPPGPECDAILVDLRLAWQFVAQHKGRRPGPLANEVATLCRQSARPMTFASLLDEIEARLARGQGCVTGLNRVRQTLDYRDKGKTIRIEFSTLRNHLTPAKKKLPTSDSREPLNHERGK